MLRGYPPQGPEKRWLARKACFLDVLEQREHSGILLCVNKFSAKFDYTPLRGKMVKKLS